jgi:Na+/H+ antiporter NhaD/arsenite permease-like protein
MMRHLKCVAAATGFMLSGAVEAGNLEIVHADMAHSWVGYGALAIFVLAYLLAMLEESTLLRKSKPMVFAASLIWALIAVVYSRAGLGAESGQAFRTSLGAYAELFLFILVSMTYLNAMEQRGVFDNLRNWLIGRNLSYRSLFWFSGCLSFLLSAVFNNLTTALLMGTVLLALARTNRSFIGIACTNIVVATNAGGSFSPFGDITTLLVWQKGTVPFQDFSALFIPAVVNFVVPSMIMHWFIPRGRPQWKVNPNPLRRGAVGIILLFAMTILTAVGFKVYLNLPPAAGMLAGLSYLSFYFFYLYRSRARDSHEMTPNRDAPTEGESHFFDVFHNVARLEWDTLLFFYGVIVSLSGLAFIGYLSLVSEFIFSTMDPTLAGILVGIVSAFIDNGTVMFTVLAMSPMISEGHWLLVTLAAGVGGSLLAIGSAAGVGLLGQTRGLYTFASHLRWTPAIALGYAASIYAHMILNKGFF